MINVIIAADHAVMRAGMKNLLNGIPDIHTNAEAAGPAQIISLVGKINGPDATVLLLDITMPGCDGLDLLKRLRLANPALPILAFGINIQAEEQLAFRALKAGAQGYLFRKNMADELAVAVRKIARSGRYICPSLAERLAEELFDFDRTKNLHEFLSDREYEILLQLVAGKSTTKIAHDLSLSVKTISTYRSRLLKKMHMDNNAQLIRYALQNNMIANS